jgi:tRNA-dihydrouridine synthase B
MIAACAQEKMIQMAFQLMLAPLEGVSDNAFRTLCYKNGADLTFTEMARVGNLARNKKGELEKISITNSTPVQIQVAGAKLPEYEKFLSAFKPTGGFRGFNLNLGCPSPEFMRQGLGAAMVKRVARVNEVVKLIGKYGYECSIKMRLGMDGYEKEKGAYLNLIRNTDASFYAVHAKTGQQKSRDMADFSVYGKCVETGKNIVANGDIVSREQVVGLENIGLYGAMVGRAAMRDPAIFRKLRGD